MADVALPIHVMLDLETLGTKPGCIVASIGACVFGDGAPRAERPTFSARLTLRDQAEAGLTFDLDTMLWWMRQSDPARQELLAEDDRIAATAALWRFGDWIDAVSAGRSLLVWANGATFDPPVIEAAFHAFRLPAPWSFRAIRDLRTLLDVAGIDGKAHRSGIAHRALDDALDQAEAAEAAFAALRRNHAGDMLAMLTRIEAALSVTWAAGPQPPGSPIYLGAVDDVWAEIRALIATAPQP